MFLCIQTFAGTCLPYIKKTPNSYCPPAIWVCMFLNPPTPKFDIIRVSTATTATPTTQTRATRWPVPSMGQSGGGRVLLCPGVLATTRWTWPWTSGRWDIHTLLCDEQQFFFFWATKAVLNKGLISLLLMWKWKSCSTIFLLIPVLLCSTYAYERLHLTL